MLRFPIRTLLERLTCYLYCWVKCNELRFFQVSLQRFFGIALIVAIAGCTGTATNTGAPGKGFLPDTSGSARKKLIKERFIIHIPKKHRRYRLGDHYVSAATQSIAISVLPSSGPALHFNANLTVGANPSNCTGSPVTCKIVLPLAAGSYTATFATYDGLLDGTGTPTGNELSANQSVGLSVVLAGTNTASFTFDGIPASVAVLPATGSSITGNMASGFALPKCNQPPQTVSVIGYDADNNQIIGPGAPATALSSNDQTYLPVSSGGSSNLFVLTPPTAPLIANSNQVVQLTASATPGSASGGAVQTAQANVTFSGQICGVITEFSSGMTANSHPTGITAGPDGNVWFTELSSLRIGRVTTGVNPTITEFPGLASPAQPFLITTGPDNNLWFSENTGNRVGRITTGVSPVITEFSSGITPGSVPQGIATGSDSTVWFTERCGKRIANISPSTGIVTEYATGMLSNSSPLTIAPGLAGTLWFTDIGSNAIGRITTGGGIMLFSTNLTASSQPWGITLGPDGNMWFTEFTGGKIGQITPAGVIKEFSSGMTAGAGPHTITAGPDGNLWFTESNANKIGKITTTGAISEFATGISSGALPYIITTGPDNNIWFTEYSGNRIGRLQ